MFQYIFSTPKWLLIWNLPVILIYVIAGLIELQKKFDLIPEPYSIITGGVLGIYWFIVLAGVFVYTEKQFSKDKERYYENLKRTMGLIKGDHNG